MIELTSEQKECVDQYLMEIDIKSLLENDPEEFEGCDFEEAWDAIYDYIKTRLEYE